jgi:hypothetical protein
MVLGQSLIGLIALACAIWVIYDVWTNQKKMMHERKIIWTVVAIFFSIITAIVYYFIEKK